MRSWEIVDERAPDCLFARLRHTRRARSGPRLHRRRSAQQDLQRRWRGVDRMHRSRAVPRRAVLQRAGGLRLRRARRRRVRRQRVSRLRTVAGGRGFLLEAEIRVSRPDGRRRSRRRGRWCRRRCGGCRRRCGGWHRRGRWIRRGRWRWRRMQGTCARRSRDGITPRTVCCAILRRGPRARATPPTCTSALPCVPSSNNAVTRG